MALTVPVSTLVSALKPASDRGIRAYAYIGRGSPNGGDFKTTLRKPWGHR